MRFCIRSATENLERVRNVESAELFSTRPSARTKPRPFKVEVDKGEGNIASRCNVTCHIHKRYCGHASTMKLMQMVNYRLSLHQHRRNEQKVYTVRSKSNGVIAEQDRL